MVERINQFSIEKNKEIPIELPLSKSISNRIIAIEGLMNDESLDLLRISESNDSQLLKSAFLNFEEQNFDFEDAGTPYRFFTAICALKKSNVNLNCNEGLKKRPIETLVNALRQLGAEIEYIEQHGFPPLKINKCVDLNVRELKINGSMSSQFLSAIFLIAPFFNNGLQIEIENEITSLPYLNMTIELMKTYGININQNKQTFIISSNQYLVNSNIKIESDWSSAAFLYGLVVVHPNLTLKLNNLSSKSLQADAICVTFFDKLGINSTFNDGSLIIKNNNKIDFKEINFDFKECPDMFPIICAVCVYLKINAHFSGIKNLRFKESDRLNAMEMNLKKLGIEFKYIDNENLKIYCNNIKYPENLKINSFKDHRIAMACSIFSKKCNVEIDDKYVIKKSFPAFWDILQQISK